jgi:hypothetical protein
MDERRNHLIVAGVLVLVGVMMLGAAGTRRGGAGGSETPGAASTTIAGPAKGTTFSGERALDSDSYRLYLVRKYGIEKNATLEKYVVIDRVFASLNEAPRALWLFRSRARRQLQLFAASS